MSLEHFIHLSSRFRHEAVSHPFVLFLALFAIVRVLGFGYRRSRADGAGDARPILLTFTSLILGVYLALVCWYLAQEQYADPAEPTIAAVAWLFRSGQPIYHAIDSPERYSHVYGPLAFIIPSWSLAVFGAGIRSSKIPGAVAAVAALAVVFTLVYRIAGRRQALFLTGVLAGLCLMFQNYTFWIRPDSIQFLSAAVALFAVVATAGVAIPGLLLGAAT
jgi:4-amino-4-deoxy-L-arabinose transferase-like glycosyltransferase